MIHLTGILRCATQEDACLVERLLPEHIRLTHAEAGCLRFSVRPMPDGLCWAVDETWVDQAALAAHRARTAASAWGRATAHIVREYSVADPGETASPPSAAPSA